MKKLIAKITLLGLTLGTASTAVAQVGLTDSGFWADPPEYQGNVVNYNDRHVWIDIWVHNLGFEKEVGIVWTDNGWLTTQWSVADYEFSYADGSEQWGVDLSPVGTFKWHRAGTHAWISNDGTETILGPDAHYIEFAIYYYDPYTGQTYWDNNNGWNHWQIVVNGGY